MFRAVLASMLIVLALLALLVGWYIFGNRVFSVQTGSMQPLLRPGDGVVVHKTAHTKLRVGDIVSFRDKNQANMVMTHRIVGINVKNGMITTKGDNNPQPDLPISSGQVIGIATHRLPKLGAAMDWLRQPLGLTLAIYVPALITIMVIVSRVSVSNTYYKR